MKVLFVGHTPPPMHGAALVGKQVLDIVDGSHEVKRLAVSSSASIAEMENGGVVKKVLGSLRAAAAVIRWLFKFRPDAVYFTPSLSGGACIRDFFLIAMGITYSKLIPVRLIAHIHMRPVYIAKHRILMSLWLWLCRRLEVVLLSRSLLADFPATFYARRVHYIANGGNAIKERGREFLRPNVLYVGHIIYSKGVFRFLENLASLAESVSVRFAGEFGSKEDEQRFYDLVSSLPTGRVQYVGRAEGEHKEQLFADADALVIPSYSEALPITMIEALSCGLPVVATAVGAIPDFITERTGFVGEFDQFFMGLNTVVTRGREYYSSDCKRAYQEHFSSTRFKDDINCLFGTENDLGRGSGE